MSSTTDISNANILRDVEKIERFYLISCTDLPLHTRSSIINQVFPALTESVYRQHFTGTPLSRSQSHSAAISKDSASVTSRRAKVAFLKICDSLSSGMATISEDGPDTDEQTPIRLAKSHHVVAFPTISKVDFLQKLEKGIAEVAQSTTDNPAETLHMEVTVSDNVLTKSLGVDGYETAEKVPPSFLERASTSTVLISSFGILIMVGILTKGPSAGADYS